MDPIYYIEENAGMSQRKMSRQIVRSSVDVPDNI